MPLSWPPPAIAASASSSRRLETAGSTDMLPYAVNSQTKSQPVRQYDDLDEMLRTAQAGITTSPTTTTVG